jgi:hypothetical protein
MSCVPEIYQARGYLWTGFFRCRDLPAGALVLKRFQPVGTLRENTIVNEMLVSDIQALHRRQKQYPAKARTGRHTDSP